MGLSSNRTITVTKTLEFYQPKLPAPLSGTVRVKSEQVSFLSVHARLYWNPPSSLLAFMTLFEGSLTLC